MLQVHFFFIIFFIGGGVFFKLPAAQLIEKCGWKGKKNGDVGVSEKHSLVLVNYGDGVANQVVNLAGQIGESVKDGFGVELEPEVQMI